MIFYRAYSVVVYNYDLSRLYIPNQLSAYCLDGTGLAGKNY
jgi:hypothetical protein